MTNAELGNELKTVISKQYRGVVDCWINSDGFATVVVKSAQVASEVTIDLLRAGFRSPKLSPPNPFCAAYTVTASR